MPLIDPWRLLRRRVSSAITPANLTAIFYSFFASSLAYPSYYIRFDNRVFCIRAVFPSAIFRCIALSMPSNSVYKFGNTCPGFIN